MGSESLVREEGAVHASEERSLSALGAPEVHLLGREPGLAASVEVDLVGLVRRRAILEVRAKPEEEKDGGGQPNEEEVFGGLLRVVRSSSERPDSLRGRHKEVSSRAQGVRSESRGDSRRRIGR